MRQIDEKVGEKAAMAAKTIGKFLASLFRIAGLFTLLLASKLSSGGSIGGYRTYGGVAPKRPTGRPQNEPDINIHDNAIHIAEFNPYMVYRFVDECIKATKQSDKFKNRDEEKLESGEFDSGETVEYP